MPLVISTSISNVSDIGNASKKGVLVKVGVYKIGGLKAFVFDKTGTLIEGVPVVTDYRVIEDQSDE